MKATRQRLTFLAVAGVACLCLVAGRAVFLSAGAGIVVTGPNAGRAENERPHPDSGVRRAESQGKLPLSFEVNKGQAAGEVKFLSRGRGYTLFLTRNEAVLALRKKSGVGTRKSVTPPFRDPHRSGADFLSKSAAFPSFFRPPAAELGDGSPPYTATDNEPRTTNGVLRMKLLGANTAAKVVGLGELPSKSNYFIGNDPKKWRTNVSTYAKVKYEGVYPGVDLVYYGNQGQLEYDFVVAPGADPGQITLDVGPASLGCLPVRGRPQGAPLHLAENGDLVVQAEGGEIRFHKPVVYQKESTIDSRRSNVNRQSTRRDTTDHGQRTTEALDGKYVLKGSNRVTFEVASYDRSRGLVIDPVLSYSTYLGGAGNDLGTDIAVDQSGSIYITGITFSSDFPTEDPVQAARGGQDIFVTKLTADGSALAYSTYLGGSDDDEALGIAVDLAGEAYVAGQTLSSDFPTASPFQGTKRSSFDTAFVTKLRPDGSGLAYSTYLGGSGGEGGLGIAVDSAGSAYVAGTTFSEDFPVTPGAFQTESRNLDAFVAKLSPDGSSLAYSTFLGGSGSEEAWGIAVDSSGSAYLTGSTDSIDFPTQNPLQATCGAGCTMIEAGYPVPVSDAFITKLTPDGSALVYSTYLGGSDDDAGSGIAVDSAGNAYVTGFTDSDDFPTASPLQGTKRGFQKAFVAKLRQDGSALLYSTYLGGSGNDAATGIALDSGGNAYVTGATFSIDFPISSPIQIACGGECVDTGDAFVTEFRADGSALVYSTYLGGSGDDGAHGIVVDSTGNAYVAGGTSSSDFPTFRPLQGTIAGGTCAFQVGGNSISFGFPAGHCWDAFVARISPVNGPAVGLSTRSLSLGSHVVGTPSLPRSVIVMDVGNAPLEISGIAASGEFTQTNACGTSLATGASCTISVALNPSTTGDATGALTISDNAVDSPQVVTLTGVGTEISLSATSLTFPAQKVGTSIARPLVVTNHGSAPVSVTSVTATGDFRATKLCASIPPHGRCATNVLFTPTQTGLRTGVLTITDSDPGSPQMVALTGTGTPP